MKIRCRLGFCCSKARYLTIYDLAVMAVCSVGLFAFSRNDSTAKVIIIIILFLKIVLGIVFWATDRPYLVKVYFYIRILYDCLLLLPTISVMVLYAFMTVVNAAIAVVFVIIAEICLLGLMFK